MKYEYMYVCDYHNYEIDHKILCVTNNIFFFHLQQYYVEKKIYNDIPIYHIVKSILVLNTMKKNKRLLLHYL